MSGLFRSLYSNLVVTTPLLLPLLLLSTSTQRRTLLLLFHLECRTSFAGLQMSDSEPETTANVRSLEDEKLDRILEQADNSDDTLYTVCPTCIDELSVATYREQLQEEGF